jgi:DNA-binding response OmpR family regulator
MTALLVERDRHLGDVLTAALRANGYDATWAASGIEAERLLRSGSYDLAVVDPHLPDLEARRLRRALRHNPAASLLLVAHADEGVERITVADLVLDQSAYRCWLADREIALRAKEFDVLALLARNCGRLVSRGDLIREVWDEHWSRSTKTLDVTMAGVRRSLREAAALSEAARTPRIVTVRGRGYRLESLAGPGAVSRR